MRMEAKIRGSQLIPVIDVISLYERRLNNDEKKENQTLGQDRGQIEVHGDLQLGIRET